MKENNGRTGEKPDKTPSTETANLMVPTTQCVPMPWFNRTDLALTPEFRKDIKTHGVRQNLLVRPTDRFTVEPGSKSGEKGKAECWCVIDRKGAKGPAIIADYPTKEEAQERCPRFEIVAGMRRWTAATEEGVATVPVRMESLTDAQARQARLTENLQRQDLTALDEGRQFQDALTSGDYGTGSQAMEALAKAVGKSRSHIYGRLRLTTLTQPVIDAVLSGALEQSAAELVATIPTDAAQKQALKLIGEGERQWDVETDKYVKVPLSVRDIKELIAEKFRRSLKKASFSPTVTYIVPVSGAYKEGCAMRPCEPCNTCPKRTGNFPDLPPGSRPDVCTDPACFEAKLDAHWRFSAAAAQKEGRPVFDAKEWEKRQGQGWWSADNSAYWDPKGRTFRALAKQANQPLGLARTRDGIIDVVDASAVRAACKPGSEGHTAPATKDPREQKAKLRSALALKLAPKILEGVAALKGADKILSSTRLLLRAVYQQTNNAHAFFAKRRKLCSSQHEARKTIEVWMGAKDRTLDEYREAILELLLCANSGVSTWTPDWAEDYQALCKLVGIDLAAEEKLEKAQKAKPAAAKGKKPSTKAKK